MIITFDLQNIDTKDEIDQFILDECSSLRVKYLTDEKKWNFAEKILDDVQRSGCGYVKKFYQLRGNAEHESSEFYRHATLLSFISKNDTYYVLFTEKCYIANDENKTFKVIN